MAPQPLISDEPPDQIDCDAVVVTATADDGRFTLDEAGTMVDSALDGALSTYLNERGYKATAHEIESVPTLGRVAPKKLVVVGLGGAGDVTPAKIRSAAALVAKRLRDHETISTSLPSAGPNDASAATIEGFVLGTYRYTAFKSDPRPAKLGRLVLLKGERAGVDRGMLTAEATVLARDLANEPPNSLTPETLAAKAQEVAEVNDLECSIWDEKELERRGFGGLLAVSQGSENPCRFVHLRYTPKRAASRVALVGKGVTFDSGGYSLKPANSMETMKTDMTGAAGVIATMSVLKRLDVRVAVDAYVPTTENLVSGRSVRPGDVIRHYDGKTTEVNNTDAEGRLILADALAYACESDPDAIVDVATLTGGIMVALGTRLSGIFANEDDLYEELAAAAEASGEMVWRMPLVDEFKKDLESEVADIKNSGPRWGSAIIGAIFLKQHVKNDIPWAHLDIAGTDWADRPHDLGPKGSTGVMTRTLIEWLDRKSAT